MTLSCLRGYGTRCVVFTRQSAPEADDEQEESLRLALENLSRAQAEIDELKQQAITADGEYDRLASDYQELQVCKTLSAGFSVSCNGISNMKLVIDWIFYIILCGLGSKR